MRTSRTMIALTTVLVLAACGGDDAGGDDAGGGDAGGDATTTEAASVSVATAEADLGTILVDGEGRTLYLFDSDPDGGSACTDACAETWPPLEGTAAATGDADGALLATVERPDGATQVTYGGHPLYHYAADGAAGDVNGQAVGEVWWVVGPDGEAIREAAATGASTPAY